MTIQVSLADGMGLREIKLAELNGVIEARMDEILENVYARLEATGLMSVLGAGIVITGGGAALKNLPAERTLEDGGSLFSGSQGGCR